MRAYYEFLVRKMMGIYRVAAILPFFLNVLSDLIGKYPTSDLTSFNPTILGGSICCRHNMGIIYVTNGQFFIFFLYLIMDYRTILPTLTLHAQLCSVLLLFHLSLPLSMAIRVVGTA